MGTIYVHQPDKFQCSLIPMGEDIGGQIFFFPSLLKMPSSKPLKSKSWCPALCPLQTVKIWWRFLGSFLAGLFFVVESCITSCHICTNPREWSQLLILLAQSCRISSRPDWNDGAIGFFEQHCPNKKKNNNKNNKISSDMGSVPAPETHVDGERKKKLAAKSHVERFCFKR